MKRILPLVLASLLTFNLMAQDNVFLDRTFWSSHPSVDLVKQKMAEGNDIAQANASNFDGVSQAILADAPLETILFAMAQKGNDLNKITHDSRTYIFWAAYKGNVALVKHLLSQGAKTDITDSKGNHIINFAAGAGQSNTQVYDLMIAHGADLKTELTPSGANALLLIAPFDTDGSLIKYFVNQGLDLNSTDRAGNGVFNYAAKGGNIPLMKQLLDQGIKGNDHAFIMASQATRGKSNDLEVYKYLESIGLKPHTVNAEGKNPLHALAGRGKDMEVVKHLLSKGVDVNQADLQGNTPFMNAASRNSLEMVELLGKKVKNLNSANKKGETALALAVAHNTPEVVNYLLQKGAKTQTVDAEGNDLTAYLMQSYSPETSAAFNQKLKLLEGKGFKFGKTQANGNSLYHLALAKNKLELIKFISQFKPDVNTANKEGLTPLHQAALKAKDTEILKYLVSIGADKNAKTEFDETAYDLASENELLSKEAVQFLK